MFLLACNLMISWKKNLAKKPSDCNYKRSNQRAGSANSLKHFHFEKLSKMTYQNDQISRMTTKDASQYYGLSKTSFSFRYEIKHLCDVLSWSVSLTYQWVRRYDASDWSVYVRTSETSQRRHKFYFIFTLF